MNRNSLKNRIPTFLQTLLLALCLILASCSLTKRSGNLEQPESTNYPFFELMPVPEILQERIWLDKFSISFNGAAHLIPSQNMLMQSELNENTINIAAMSFDGVPLAQASWEQKTNKLVSQNAIDKNFNPKQVLHDLQCVNWPLPLLQKALFNGFSVDENIIGDVKIRRFYFNNKLIVKITKQLNTFSFEQMEQGYQITVIRLQDNHLSTTAAIEFK